MYMMEKLDAYKQEIERQDAWREYSDKHNWHKDHPDKTKILVLYAREMLRIHDDVKKYCNALLVKAQEHDTAVDRAVFELRKLNEKYDDLNKKYKALKRQSAPVKKPAAKKPAAKKVAKPKGT
jgi:hypothetical protein